MFHKNGPSHGSNATDKWNIILNTGYTNEISTNINNCSGRFQFQLRKVGSSNRRYN